MDTPCFKSPSSSDTDRTGIGLLLRPRVQFTAVLHMLPELLMTNPTPGMNVRPVQLTGLTGEIAMDALGQKEKE
eukprot:758113-Hanusia_phi.AAC.1